MVNFVNFEGLITEVKDMTSPDGSPKKGYKIGNETIHTKKFLDFKKGERAKGTHLGGEWKNASKMERVLGNQAELKVSEEKLGSEPTVTKGLDVQPNTVPITGSTMTGINYSASTTPPPLSMPKIIDEKPKPTTQDHIIRQNSLSHATKIIVELNGKKEIADLVKEKGVLGAVIELAMAFEGHVKR